MNISRIGSSLFGRGGGNAHGIIRHLSQLSHNYDEIISLENLCLAWEEFIIGKKKKRDVQSFSENLMDNIVALHEILGNRAYRHGGYKSFYINDPKRRHIHKASVADRLLHHAVYRVLYPFFDKKFIADSFSCRIDKGTHKAIRRFGGLSRQASVNNTRTLWALKCDIRKFFASIHHETLLSILREHISNQDIICLLQNIITSFHTESLVGVGLPLGNLTSQLFANIYMNEFDQFMKHKLKTRHYIRYADDFVIVSPDKQWLQKLIPQIALFLEERLKLALHPDKTFIKTLASGVDFLGWVHFPDHRVLRNSTKRRMMVRIKESYKDEAMQSYLGLLKHGNTNKLRKEVLMADWLYGKSH